jgi:putative transposase
MLLPTRSDKRWSLDFVSDQLANGWRFRVLNIVDDFSRICVGQIVDTSISGARQARYLDELDGQHQLPHWVVLRQP